MIEVTVHPAIARKIKIAIIVTATATVTVTEIEIGTGIEIEIEIDIVKKGVADRVAAVIGTAAVRDPVKNDAVVAVLRHHVKFVDAAKALPQKMCLR